MRRGAGRDVLESAAAGKGSPMSVPEAERGPSKPEEFLALYRQMDNLLKEMRRGVERDWERAQDAIATLIRTQTAQGLAPAFFARKRPWEGNAELATLIEHGILNHAAFIQKTPLMLAFYRRLLTGLEREPTSILEIGVKGGGSTAFWKALFPGATVVGVDIALRRWLTSKPSTDGVVYLQGDQSDAARLEEIAVRHGPFDLVIDDGSHVTEDTHASVSKPGQTGDFGDDIWPDFTLAVLQRLRRGPLPPASPGVQLASAVSRMIAD